MQKNKRKRIEFQEMKPVLGLQRRTVIALRWGAGGWRGVRHLERNEEERRG